MRRIARGCYGSIEQRRCMTITEYNAIGPSALLHRRLKCRLKCSTNDAITEQQFESMAKECGVTDTVACRQLLMEAGCLVDFGSYIHLRPAVLLQQVNDWSVATETNIKLQSLIKEEADLRSNLSDPLRKLSNWRRLVWSVALAFSGLQMCIIAYLTFHESGVGWDVMEPVSYFIGCYTSLLFFCYLLRYRREHSYVGFDKTIVTPRLRGKYTRDFDWGKYDDLCANLKSLEGQSFHMTQWMKKN